MCSDVCVGMRRRAASTHLCVRACPCIWSHARRLLGIGLHVGIADGAPGVVDIARVFLGTVSFRALYRLYLGIADGMSIVRVWACRYSK